MFTNFFYNFLDMSLSFIFFFVYYQKYTMVYLILKVFSVHKLQKLILVYFNHSLKYLITYNINLNT